MKNVSRLKNNKGTIFITTLISTFLMTLVGGYAYEMATRDLHFVHRMEKAAQAQQLAEAGMSRAISAYSTNWTTYIGSTFSGTLDTGSYSAHATASGSRYLLTSTGTVDDVTRSVTAEVAGATGTTALNYAFAAGGNATIDSGTGQSPGTIVGNIYSAGNTTLDGPSSGGVLAITGSSTAGGNITSNSSVTLSGTSTQHYTSSVPFPTVSMSYYQGIAQTNGQYYSGNKSYTSTSTIPAAPAGGVIYVAGNITIEGTQTTRACLVAGGNITINKSGNTYPKVTVTAPSSLPAVVSQGNFTFSSNGNGGAYLRVTGLLYSQGNMTYSSGNHDELTVTGSVVSRGNITVSPTAQNSMTVTYNSSATSSISGMTTSGASQTFEVVSYNE